MVDKFAKWIESDRARPHASRPSRPGRPARAPAPADRWRPPVRGFFPGRKVPRPPRAILLRRRALTTGFPSLRPSFCTPERVLLSPANPSLLPLYSPSLSRCQAARFLAGVRPPAPPSTDCAARPSRPRRRPRPPEPTPTAPPSPPCCAAPSPATPATSASPEDPAPPRPCPRRPPLRLR
ncbi:hypothetical protein BRADI_3g15112v3 [Brachypodium distachyon]|uniref:Uncharacterized protein n=1 Tax=Brachypodium distachyon TaxID=15368 RepID=A0A2K2CX86_BRADI|nr:hypothetical protein BRADI_3g15112v3 [Brachypodium distachyon]